MRFNRDYELIAGLDGVTVRPPLRISFSCKKSVSGGLNKLTLKIYNLKESNRLKLVKDEEEQVRIPILLSVGYDGNLQNVFKGTINKGENSLAGNDFITTLDCLDGGFDFINSFTSQTVVGKENALAAILNDMPNTGRGKISKQNNLIRPKVLVGNSIKLIEQQLNDGEKWFIDDEKLNILLDGEVISSFAPVISAETGMTNTPERKNQKITVRTMLNPTVKIGGLFEVISKTAPHLDGLYKCESMEYAGDLDGSEWSQVVTGLKHNG